MCRLVFWKIPFEPSQNMGRDLYSRDDVDLIEYPFIKKNEFVEKCCEELRQFKRDNIKIWMLKHLLKIPKYDRNEKICFIHVMTWNRVFEPIGYIDILRKKYPHSKHVLDITDIHRGRKLYYNMLKEIYDDIWVYEKKEAEINGITYVPPRYSKVYNLPDDVKEDIDVFFAGHATDRLNELQEVCNLLSSNGLNCYFYITGVEKERRKPIPGIVYASSHMNSDETFSFTARAKCLLEIGHYDSGAITARAREAVIYNKKLLTNNRMLEKDKYYNPKMMQVYSKVEEISLDFFHGPKESYNYDGDYNPELIFPYCEALWN